MKDLAKTQSINPKAEAINYATELIKTHKNVDSDFLNEKLKTWVKEQNDFRYLELNVDACQYQAKLTLMDEGLVEWSDKQIKFIIVEK